MQERTLDLIFDCSGCSSGVLGGGRGGVRPRLTCCVVGHQEPTAPR